MTADGWVHAQQILHAWPAVPADLPADGTCQRLRDALVGLAKGEAGWRDVASLVRQILLEEEARQGTQVPLSVPVAAGLPTREQWRQVHCHSMADGERLSITAQPWHPPTGPDEQDEVAAGDLREVHHRRLRRPVSDAVADPFWSAALGYGTYLSVGQRQAARTVALAPAGSTTIVCLPTGHGKTEVALAPALLARDSREVTVVVVPTVVLALDLERRVRQLLVAAGEVSPTRPRHAYTGDLSDDEKQAIRDNVRNGRQRILITSPEALVTGLSDALAAAAEAGYLRRLIIDEAHLVEQWGTEFRPAFQAMASQRLTWLSMAPPGRQVATIAMSATLTQRQIRTLTDLFANGEVALVWASGLRQEPSYYLQRCTDEQTRREAVLTAVGLLPRPLVVYTATRDDVKDWVVRLRAAGFERVAHVTGDSTDEQRLRAVDGWRSSSDGSGGRTLFDIVVGTSAFGLGVDASEVRSVIHACLPETIDRYYQEVGRGGRDGHPCLAYLTTAPVDARVARNLNNQVVIGAELGWDRWHSMVRGAGMIGPRTYAVRLDALPPHLPRDSVRNQQWNVRTLNLMVRAGLIRLLASKPPRRGEGEDDAQFVARLDEFYTDVGARIDVEIVDEATNERSHWEHRVSAERKRIAHEQHAALQRMHEVVRGGRCIGEILAGYYRVGWRGGWLATGINCRGCPHCRATGLPEPHSPYGLYRSALEPFPAVHAWRPARPDPLAPMRGGAAWVSIWWANDGGRDDLVPQLLERIARRGMSVFGGPGLDSGVAEQLQATARPWPVIVDDDHDLVTSYEGPVVWLLDETSLLSDPIIDRLPGPDLTYLIHPRTLASPDRPGVRLIDVCPAQLSVETALGVL